MCCLQLIFCSSCPIFLENLKRKKGLNSCWTTLDLPYSISQSIPLCACLICFQIVHWECTVPPRFLWVAALRNRESGELFKRELQSLATLCSAFLCFGADGCFLESTSFSAGVSRTLLALFIKPSWSCQSLDPFVCVRSRHQYTT